GYNQTDWNVIATMRFPLAVIAGRPQQMHLDFKTLNFRFSKPCGENKFAYYKDTYYIYPYKSEYRYGKSRLYIWKSTGQPGISIVAGNQSMAKGKECCS